MEAKTIFRGKRIITRIRTTTQLVTITTIKTTTTTTTTTTRVWTYNGSWRSPFIEDGHVKVWDNNWPHVIRY